MESYSSLPVTVRRSIELIGLYFLGVIIIAGKGIITPLLMAFFLAIMLLPIYRFLKRKGLPEAACIGLSILVLIISLGGLIYFFSTQLSNLAADFPRIKQNVGIHLNSLQTWIETKTHLTAEKQVAMLKEQNEKILNWASTLAGGAAASISSVLIFIGLLPIYIFLFLFYKNLLIRFVFLWFPKDSHTKVEEVVRESEIIIKSYLIGLLIQITYITVLLGGILLVFGIRHAILIGVIFAILNLIPYIGALIGNIIGVLITLSSSPDFGPILIVLGTIAFVQFLDNNILMPRIVGSKVKINAMATIVGVLVAGALAGIPGMFLSLPVIAVFKIIFDRTNNLKQWGVLFGDERPKASPLNWPILRSRSKKVQKKLEQENDIKPPTPNSTA